MIIDQYTTVQETTSIRQVIERSRFIAYVTEVDTEEEAKQFIDSIKEEHRQATHNCSAYSVGIPSDEKTFFDDDGEPSGSAGKPILGAILKQELTNVAVVVTRYFGGKKLGIRGLIDAYGGVAEEALISAGKAKRIIHGEIRLVAEYEQVNRIMYLIDKHQAKIVDSEYGEKVKMRLAIRKSLLQLLQEELEPYVNLVNV